MSDRLYTAVDASFNRALEGLRVCEDVCRFVLRDEPLSVSFKDRRHALARLMEIFPQGSLLRARDVARDPIKLTDAADEKTRKSPAEILSRNLHRAAEAIRSLEEFSKLASAGGEGFQALRFSLYTLEQDAVFALNRGRILEKFNNSLYALCDPAFAGDDLMAAARGLIAGGATIIQLRMKDAPAGRFLAAAREMAELCRERDIVFIVNDRPDIALCAGAQGVHLGQDDLPVEEARRVLPPDMIIGVSTHSREEADAALEKSPDYLAIGPVFDTSSKSGERMPGIGTGLAGRIASTSPVPVVAIGGIEPGGIGELARAGIRSYAVMSYLFKGDPAQRCREFMRAMEKTGYDG